VWKFDPGHIYYKHPDFSLKIRCDKLLVVVKDLTATLEGSLVTANVCADRQRSESEG
jgi:hypothetical protein